jgi:dienelactone hydrolase
MLSGMAADGGKTSDFPDRNAARDAIYRLSQEQVTADLKAVADYAKKTIFFPLCFSVNSAYLRG